MPILSVVGVAVAEEASEVGIAPEAHDPAHAPEVGEQNQDEEQGEDNAGRLGGDEEKLLGVGEDVAQTDEPDHRDSFHRRPERRVR